MGDPATTLSGALLKGTFLATGAGAVGFAGVKGAQTLAKTLAPDIRFPKQQPLPPARTGEARERVRRRFSQGAATRLTTPLGLTGRGGIAAKTLLGG